MKDLKGMIIFAGLTLIGAMLFMNIGALTKSNSEIVKVQTSKGLETWHCVQVDDNKYMCEINK